MRVKFIHNQSEILTNLLFEIESKEKVESYGLTTILPPDKFCRAYLKNKDKNSIESIKKWMLNDLEKNNFTELLKQSEEIWQKVNDNFFIELSNIKKDITEKYNIYPTLYGPGGSYVLPNKAFIRIAKKNDMDYLDVNIAHEIIHLNVEDVVQQKKLSHDDKELLVNSIMFQPGIARIFGINNEEIKKSKYYNNLDEILQ